MPINVIRKFFPGKPKAQEKKSISLNKKVTNLITSKKSKKVKINDKCIEEHQDAVIVLEPLPEQQLIGVSKTREISDSEAQLASDHRWTLLEIETLALKDTFDVVELDLANDRKIMKSHTTKWRYTRKI
jgi:hypothetical protein